jgi:peptide/nickel transport system substrate-binding protein
MHRRTFTAGAATLALGATRLATPAIAQGGARVLRFVPQSNLVSPDPVWTTATIATIHGYMVWDSLYGVDTTLTPRPQMLAGHDIAADRLTWTLHLRDGLLFHDGEKVRAADCVASLRRWAERNPFGQLLNARLAGMRAVDDRRIEVRLTRPYPLLPYALGATSCFMMPERIARVPATTQITEFIGSGPFRFLPDQWVSGVGAEYARFDRYAPRDEAPDGYAGGKIVHFDRVRWLIQPDPATAIAALQTNEVDWVEQPLIDLLPMLQGKSGIRVQTNDPLGTMEMLVFNQLHPPFDNPKLRRALLPAIAQADFIGAIVGAQTALGRTGIGFFPDGSPYASGAGMDALTGPRDLGAAKRLVAESGYKGEPVVLLQPTDAAPLLAVSEIAADRFRKLGLNVRPESMDLGTLTARRNKQDAVAQGG